MGLDCIGGSVVYCMGRVCDDVFSPRGLCIAVALECTIVYGEGALVYPTESVS